MPLDAEFLQASVEAYVIILPKLSVKEAKERNQDLLIKFNQVFLGVKTYHNGFTVSVMTLFMRFSSLQNDSVRESVCKKIQRTTYWSCIRLSQLSGATHTHVHAHTYTGPTGYGFFVAVFPRQGIRSPA